MKKKHYLLFLLASLFLLTDVVWAQTSATVSGVVIDENGETLPGVSVVEVGTTNGVLTDLNGHYTLKTTSAKPSVSFSYIGYQTTTLPLNGRTKLDVQMKVETKVLDEVVVVGYGVQKKVNLTGSVTSINFADQTEGRPIMSVSSALSGLAAGMNVTQASGQPGSDGATIRVRGNGTFNTNSPLVLVDGIEWSMDNVNPNDIESISVLKDAASTAIYGTRAANGVILITTKSGKGKPQISYSYSGVVQMPYNNLSFVSDYARYMGLVNEACENVNTKGIFSQESIDRWRAASADPNQLRGLSEHRLVRRSIRHRIFAGTQPLCLRQLGESEVYALLGLSRQSGSHEPLEPRFKYAENQFPYQSGSQDCEMDDRRYPPLRTKARLRDGKHQQWIQVSLPDYSGRISGRTELLGTSRTGK